MVSFPPPSQDLMYRYLVPSKRHGRRQRSEYVYPPLPNFWAEILTPKVRQCIKRWGSREVEVWGGRTLMTEIIALKKGPQSAGLSLPLCENSVRHYEPESGPETSSDTACADTLILYPLVPATRRNYFVYGPPRFWDFC